MPGKRRVGKDPNMKTAREWGWTMLEYPNDIVLPPALTPKTIAEIVDTFDGDLVQAELLHKLNPFEAQRRCMHVGAVISGYFTGYTFPSEGAVQYTASVALRLWSGCISAAKVIALETRSGPNTVQYRKKASRTLLRTAQIDKVFAAGVVAAVEFKKRRKQPYDFSGIPMDIQMAFWPEALWLKPKEQKKLLNDRKVRGWST
jgi:hypothetical protein